MPGVEAHDICAVHHPRGGEVLRPKGVAREGGNWRLQRDHWCVQRCLTLSLLWEYRSNQGKDEVSNIIYYIPTSA